jgi:putative phosphoribosyl transferase
MADIYPRFSNRIEAGQILGAALELYAGTADTIILALPRGGVPVAHEVAKILKLPLDLWLVRKLGVPGHEELAMGALASGNVSVLNEPVIQMMNVSGPDIGAVMSKERAELARRDNLYRHGKPPPDVSGKTVIVVDDGLATGSTMRAAIASLRQAGAARIVAATPVCAQSTKEELRKEADEVICPCTPEPFWGVGMWYEDFTQTTDDEVQQILAMEGHDHDELRP